MNKLYNWQEAANRLYCGLCSTINIPENANTNKIQYYRINTEGVLQFYGNSDWCKSYNKQNGNYSKVKIYALVGGTN